jgi:molybdenum-dependent DNA-binding transcriptional regulator ModE
VLTPEGERILNAYERFAADINAYSQERFQENFRDLVEQP